MKVLTGHTSAETAYTVADYPYGFRLRCQIRYWIETKKGQGQRCVSQTTNPKRLPAIVWNKPKASTYSAIKVLFIDDVGHVQCDGLHAYESEDKIQQFATTYADALTDDRSKAAIEYMYAAARASKRVTWSVRTQHEGDAPIQTQQEQREIMRSVIADELKRKPTDGEN